MRTLDEKNLIRGLMFHLTYQIHLPKTLISIESVAEASSSSAGTIGSGAL